MMMRCVAGIGERASVGCGGVVFIFYTYQERAERRKHDSVFELGVRFRSDDQVNAWTAVPSSPLASFLRSIPEDHQRLFGWPAAR